MALVYSFRLALSSSGFLPYLLNFLSQLVLLSHSDFSWLMHFDRAVADPSVNNTISFTRLYLPYNYYSMRFYCSLLC